MKSKLDTVVVTMASGAVGGAAAYSSAVSSMGFISFCLWKVGIPMVAILSGPAIAATATAAAVVGGGAYCVVKGIASRREKLERVASEYDFRDGIQS
ncbi:MAG: hypothetical protein WCO89_00515 [Syntrophus sp. (in: bacteria)]